MSPTPLGTTDLEVGDVLLFDWPSLAALRAHNATLPKPKTDGELVERDCVNRLIVALDETAYVHSAVVVAKGPPVEIADSLHETAVVDLDKRCEQYGASKILVRRPTRGSAGSISAAATQLAATHLPYPYGDLALSGVDLRVRRLIAEHREERLFRDAVDAFLETMRPVGGPRGYMCAAFVSAAFTNAGTPLEVPVREFHERDDGITGCESGLRSVVASTLLPFLEGNGVGAADAVIRGVYENALADFVVNGSVGAFLSVLLNEVQLVRAGYVPYAVHLADVVRQRWEAHHDSHDPNLWTPGDLEHTSSLHTVGELTSWCSAGGAGPSKDGDPTGQ